MSTHKVSLEDGALEATRRAMMNAAAVDMKHAIEELERLATLAPWPAGVQSSDTQTAVAIAREGLAIVDALGWPADAGRDEATA